MGKVTELSNRKRQMAVDLHKSGNGYQKKKHKRFNVSLNTVRVIITHFQTSGTLQTCQEEDASACCPHGRKMVREAKSSPRTIVQKLQTLVASCGHKLSKSTIRRHHHTNRLLWKGCMKKALIESNQQIQASEVFQQRAMVRWDQNRTFWPCTPSTCLTSKEGCIQGKAPHT